MFKKILLGLAAILIILIVVIAMQPADFKVERSTVIAASPEIVHGQVNDFTQWQHWSPWAKMDPETEITISENPAGEGAMYAWVSEKTGEGIMTITSSTPEAIAIAMNFVKPFKAENTVTFTFAPIHGGTHLAWTMTGRNGFMGKAIGLFMDVDDMIGADFDKGLKDIKRRAEIESGWIKE